MENKVKYGQFYTKRSSYIIGNLLNDIDKKLTIVEPFCGEGDLLLFENNLELYDIEPRIEGCILRNTLLEPPNYSGKLVVTNPPFLGKNKSKDKEIYEMYKVSDLYKAAIKSILDCEGGILIVPLNFFCDEDNETREAFFDRFQILNLNIFEEAVFDDTAYTVCSFSFIKRTKKLDYIECIFHPSEDVKELDLKKSNGYRIGGDFLEIIDNQKNIGISRLQEGGQPNSKLYLRAIDTGSKEGRISLSIRQDPFYGKRSDRVFASLITDKKYTIDQEELICKHFNRILEYSREKYNSLFLTSYRNSSKEYSRKRISFDVSYKLISYIIEKYIK